MYSTRRSNQQQFKPILSIWLFLFSIIAYSQSNVHTRHFTTKNGLPHNNVKDLSVDSKGFVWLATEGGLIRFDGRNFRVFGKDHKAGSSNAVWAIAPGRRNSNDPSKLDVAYVTFATGNRANIRDGNVYPVPRMLMKSGKVYHSG